MEHSIIFEYKFPNDNGYVLLPHLPSRETIFIVINFNVNILYVKLLTHPKAWKT